MDHALRGAAACQPLFFNLEAHMQTTGETIVAKYHGDATHPLQERYRAMAAEIDSLLARTGNDVHRWGTMKLGDVQPAYDVIDHVVKEGPELYLKFIAEQCLRGLRAIGTPTARRMVQAVVDVSMEADRAEWGEAR